MKNPNESIPPKEHFVQTSVYEGNVVFQNGKDFKILIESRMTWDAIVVLYTKIGEDTYRVESIEELVSSVPKIKSIEIPHKVYLSIDGEMVVANLTEVFSSGGRGNKKPIIFQVKLIIMEKVYRTSDCETLTDAIWELDEIMSQDLKKGWRLFSCYDCRFSYFARSYLNSDRMYWCSRDVSTKDLEEIESKGKFASQKSLFAGVYYVDAFHYCAAWTAKKPIK